MNRGPWVLADTCNHDAPRTIRGETRGGFDVTLLVGGEVVRGDAALWCDRCGALGLPIDGGVAWVDPTPTPFSRGCPNCGARAQVDRADLPLVACIACGWALDPQHDRRGAVAAGAARLPLDPGTDRPAGHRMADGSTVLETGDPDARERAAIQALDDAKDAVARAAGLLELVRGEGDGRPALVVYREEWDELQSSLEQWHRATQAFLAILPRRQAP
jgi:hypothetical protein